MKDRIRIHELPEHIGKEVTIAGWVDIRRDHGKLIFVDLRDESEQVQVVFSPKANEEAHRAADVIRPEWVVQVTGLIKERPEKLINKEEHNGSIEFEAHALTVLNEAITPPFEVNKGTEDVGEDIRMQYRYMDLRTKRMQSNIRNRAKVIKFIRDYLEQEKFVEIETPILTKSTPEGARDYLVPSRIYPGEFYALPQSPQQYKQFLMNSCFEKYFQIARCFRDEDTRGDRQAEFTQLDLEVAFPEQSEILDLIESMYTAMVEKLYPQKTITTTPWPRLNYADVMKEHGTDSPDLRKDTNDPNELAFAWVINFPLFEEQKEDDFFHGAGSAKFAPSHHMFTAPHADDIALLDSDPTKVRGLQHDLVLNGSEVAGGSIRIHDPKMQEKIFELIGFSDEQKQMFDHFLRAFQYGVPPHGGIASGLDRLIAILQGEESIREVIAFPKTGEGRELTMEAPSPVESVQLADLNISVTQSKEK